MSDQALRRAGAETHDLRAWRVATWAFRTLDLVPLSPSQRIGIISRDRSCAHTKSESLRFGQEDVQGCDPSCVPEKGSYRSECV